MAIKDWPGGVISKTPVTPAGSYAGSAASGVWTLDQVAYWNKQGTWPGLVPGDPYFDYVSMLLTGDGTNGAQNNTFLDSSANNFTITRNGNATQGTFSPYGNLWSFYSGVEGNGDAIYVANNTITNFGTGDFTVECWINQIGTAESYFINSNNGTGLGCLVNVNGGGVGHLRWFNGNSVMIDYNAGFQLGTWYHIAICRSGTTTRMFINGALVASISDSSDYQIGGNTSIGGSADSSWCNKMYISNVRIVKGVALYTAAFSPSSAPLTAVTGTSLLACQSNRFKDNSSNNYTFVTVNSPKIQRFSPFNPPVPYSTSTIGGSGYFDGTGDYLTTPQNAAFNIGTGQFTVECWVYWNGTTTAGAYGVINLGNGANSGGPYTGWALILISGSTPSFYRYNGTEYYCTSSTAITANTWSHIAISRNSGNTLSMWINGVRVYTGTITTSYNNVNSDPLNIGYRTDGAGGAHYFPGYISNARVVVGTDVYGASNSTITVPTAPLTAIANTQLLTSMTNAGIPDAAMMNDLETVGNAQVSTSVVKYGTGSLAFDGTGDWLTMPVTQNFNFGTGDLTIEGWINVPSIDATYRTIFSVGPPVQIYARSGTVEVYFNDSDNYVTYIVSGMTGPASSIAVNTWAHIAVVRSGTTFTAYVNGVAGASVTGVSAAVALSATGAQVGAIAGAYPYIGYIDDLRITKGYARYTTNFTAPTAAFPTY